MRIKRVLIETEDGTVTNITDLSLPDYEQFMDTMHEVRTMYIALKEEEEKGKSVEPETE